MRVLVRVSPAVEGVREVEATLEPGGETLGTHSIRPLDHPPGVAPCEANLPSASAPHVDLYEQPPLLHELITRFEEDDLERGDVELLGRYLFDCLLGHTLWERILAVGKEQGVEVVELALSWPSDQYDLHRLSWEAMHDGTDFLGVHRTLSAAVLRMVEDAKKVTPKRHSAPARVLFAVGAELNDPYIRPGAEVVGLLRGLGRTGSPIDSSIVDKITLSKLAEKCEQFKPHIVHFVSHGDLDPDGRGRIQLYPDELDDDGLVGGGQLLYALGAAGELPELVVLTGCKSAAAGEHMDSLAAELVKEGVPTVIGMAGRISDPVCRLFSRKFGIALSSGDRLLEAVIHGRRAGLMQQERDPADDLAWALPSLYVSPRVTADHSLVDTSCSAAIVERIRNYDLRRDPVFCGRRGFGRLFEKLLDDREDLQVLLALADGRERLGKTRLLCEFASRALWAGHVVVMIDDNLGDKTVLPSTSVQLAAWLLEGIEQARTHFGMSGVFDSELRGELETVMDRRLRLGALSSDRRKSKLAGFLGDCKTFKGEKGALEHSIATALRADLATLMEEARALDSNPVDERSHPVLVLGEVGYWGDAASLLCHRLLGPNGLKAGNTPVPVFATGSFSDAAGEILRQERGRATNRPWIRYEELKAFDDDEGALAYQWVLLHPWSQCKYGDTTYASDPYRDPEGKWKNIFQEKFEGIPGCFDSAEFYEMAHILAVTEFFVEANDDQLLDQYASRL